jgi:nickel/cobalt exporter
MDQLVLLLGSAAAVGFLHTVLGPDHYLPFVALSRARGWSLRKTLAITGLCGLGHIAGSVAIGLIGIATGVALRTLDLIESHRGEIAAWLLIAFGLAYGAWGLVRARRGRRHTHVHAHDDGIVHVHEHTHHGDHTHVHAGRSATPWVLFTIFVFGPCEPLIPLLMYPAVAMGPWAVVLVVAVFGALTIATMTAAVALLRLGAGRIPVGPLTRYGHALAGGIVLLCGLAVRLGL